MPNGNVGRFQRAAYEGLTLEQLIIDTQGHASEAECRVLFAQMKREKLYRSDYYQVAIDKDPPHGFKGMIIWHLSVKRLDKEPIFDWRDMQAIKNQLCGEEVEAIQLMPAESRLIDSANQYHFYAFMKGGKTRAPRIPVGWTRRFVTDEQWVNGKQRPFINPGQR